MQLQDFREGIEKALEAAGGTHRYEDVEELLRSGAARAWLHGKSMVVARAISTPEQKILFFWIGVGELEELSSLVNTICENCEGFDKAVFIGRKGWQRSPLMEDGWKPTMIQYTRDL